jgi:hypothetical protein
VWNDRNKQCAQLGIRKTFTHSKLTTSHCFEPSCTDFQPGGTAIGVFGRWTHRILQPINDVSGMGRWSGLKFRTKHNTTLCVITAYIPQPEHHHLANI